MPAARFGGICSGRGEQKRIPAPPRRAEPAPAPPHLHCLAQVVAAALALDDRLVDLAGGEVVVAGQADVQEALVVAQVQVGLRRGGAAAAAA